jgi:bromodomain-containing factor 1
MAVDTTPTQTPITPSHPHPELGSQGLSSQQYRFLLGVVRSIKKVREASPFLKPVDTVALGIPHYHTVIKHPMDFGTVERKLLSSNPGKPDTNLSNPRYHSAEEFIQDVRLIFSNCLTFNGPDHVVSGLAKRVEEHFDKQMKGFSGTEVRKHAPFPTYKMPTGWTVETSQTRREESFTRSCSLHSHRICPSTKESATPSCFQLYDRCPQE